MLNTRFLQANLGGSGCLAPVTLTLMYNNMIQNAQFYSHIIHQNIKLSVPNFVYILNEQGIPLTDYNNVIQNVQLSTHAIQ